MIGRGEWSEYFMFGNNATYCWSLRVPVSNPKFSKKICPNTIMSFLLDLPVDFNIATHCASFLVHLYEQL